MHVDVILPGVEPMYVMEAVAARRQLPKVQKQPAACYGNTTSMMQRNYPY